MPTRSTTNAIIDHRLLVDGAVAACIWQSCRRPYHRRRPRSLCAFVGAACAAVGYCGVIGDCAAGCANAIDAQLMDASVHAPPSGQISKATIRKSIFGAQIPGTAAVMQSTCTTNDEQLPM